MVVTNNIYKMDEEKYYEIRKLFILDGKNFSNWKFRLETMLKEHGIEEFLSKTTYDFQELMVIQPLYVLKN